MKMSQELYKAIRLSKKRHYQLAAEAKIHQSTFSKLLTGIEKIKKDDPRVISIGKVLGFKPENCFEEDANEAKLKQNNVR